MYVLEEYYESQWFQKVNLERAISGQGRKKLEHTDSIKQNLKPRTI